MSMKASDYSCVPLCADCHTRGPLSYYRIGKRAFERVHGVRLPPIVAPVTSRSRINNRVTVQQSRVERIYLQSKYSDFKELKSFRGATGRLTSGRPFLGGDKTLSAISCTCKIQGKYR